MARNALVLWDSVPVITGQELKDARSRANLTQSELAQLLQHKLRTIQNWERDGVSHGKEPLVRAALGNYLSHSDAHPPLEAYSNFSLMAEIMRRLEAGSTDSDGGHGWQRGRGAGNPDDHS